MSCEKCKEYLSEENPKILSLSPTGLEEVFDVEITSSGGAWCSGKGTCKSCQQKIHFDFENFIYDKMSIRKVKSTR